MLKLNVHKTKKDTYKMQEKLEILVPDWSIEFCSFSTIIIIKNGTERLYIKYMHYSIFTALYPEASQNSLFGSPSDWFGYANDP